MNEQDVGYMRQALQLAEAALVEGNIPVGSLIVQGDQIIATASELLPNSLDITSHAEVLAIRRACEHLQTLDLRGCTLYTTAEPCWMCSYAIRESQISRVVIGTETLDVGGISTRYPLLVDATIPIWPAPPQVTTGVLRAECQALRQGYRR